MTGKVLRAAFWTVFFIAWFAASCVLVEITARALGRGWMPSLEAAAAFGGVAGASTLVMMQVTRRGWIRIDGIFFPRTLRWRSGKPSARPSATGFWQMRRPRRQPRPNPGAAASPG